MKLKVMSENPITFIEYKKVIDLARSSKSLEKDLYELFPERCKSVTTGKKSIVVWFDKKSASSHKYETTF